jgi:hypothetical protein
MYNKPLSNTQPIEPSALYRCRDASCLLGGISQSTLARWRVVGCGPKFVKVGRMVTYRGADLIAFLDHNTFSSTSSPPGQEIDR